jgi:hypothetical protein
MEEADQASFKDIIGNLNWVEAMEQVWLSQLADIVPNDVHLAIIDLVTACKGLIETGSALQEIVVRLYDERRGETSVISSLAEDESSSFFSRQEVLLIDGLYSDKVFSFFLKPLSEINE